MSHPILLVEDDRAIPEPLVFGLQQEGLSATWVTKGEEALDALGRQQIDLALLDVMLPDLSGFDVCRRIRQRSNVIVIMLTARGQALERVMGLESGADDYVVKPFSFRELLARVRALLRRRQLDTEGRLLYGALSSHWGALSSASSPA